MAKKKKDSCCPAPVRLGSIPTLAHVFDHLLDRPATLEFCRSVVLAYRPERLGDGVEASAIRGEPHILIVNVIECRSCLALHQLWPISLEPANRCLTQLFPVRRRVCVAVRPLQEPLVDFEYLHFLPLDNFDRRGATPLEQLIDFSFRLSLRQPLAQLRTPMVGGVVHHDHAGFFLGCRLLNTGMNCCSSHVMNFVLCMES
mmetsp:Transcript_17005/g.52201  ORF Transcript_17005/g.52201 Transcript_17005/m.52201 type:complete len:201 (-) Transcript_17005:2794-3396(-)